MPNTYSTRWLSTDVKWTTERGDKDKWGFYGKDNWSPLATTVTGLSSMFLMNNTAEFKWMENDISKRLADLISNVIYSMYIILYNIA